MRNDVNDSSLDINERLAALRFAAGGKQWPGGNEINNHIHTIYSFSPYTPSMAALCAREAGLCAAGSVDHDSIAAAKEMLEACAILGIGGCVGFEVRVSFLKRPDGTAGPFAGRKINNPDSEGNVYMTVQGIPSCSITAAAEFLKPIREERLKRTKAMTLNANILLKEADIEAINFENDILAKSKFSEGGEITERHLVAAISGKIIKKYTKGRGLLEALNRKFNINVSAKLSSMLWDEKNPFYEYDLLGILKSEFLPRIFIQPDENECIPANRVTAFADSISAISAYAYLGDVAESPTGDKKAEKFEDEFVDDLFAELSRIGYKAVTYMPPRNTKEQLKKIRQLSSKWNFMEISGVDINSPRQLFNCPEVLQDEFVHLIDTTWALIAHERFASVDSAYGLLSDKNPLCTMNLSRRIETYASFGKKLDLYHPDDSAADLVQEIFKGRV